MAGSAQNEPRKRVVVIGAGFAGIEVARGLGGSRADVTLIDKQNYHLFQPLLYQVATAALSECQRHARRSNEDFRGGKAHIFGRWHFGTV